MKIELIRDGETLSLRLGRRKPFPLDAEARGQLAAIAAELVETAYVIEIELPYTDYDGYDQGTPAYHTSMCTGDKELARRAMEAIDRELVRIERHGLYHELRKKPEAGAEGNEFSSVEEALAMLRSDLIAHQSDSVKRDHGYWAASGFDIVHDRSKDEVSGADADMLDVVDEAFEGIEYDDDLAEKLDEYLGRFPHEEWTEPWIDKLKRWARGEDLVGTDD